MGDEGGVGVTPGQGSDRGYGPVRSRPLEPAGLGEGVINSESESSAVCLESAAEGAEPYARLGGRWAFGSRSLGRNLGEDVVGDDGEAVLVPQVAAEREDERCRPPSQFALVPRLGASSGDCGFKVASHQERLRGRFDPSIRLTSLAATFRSTRRKRIMPTGENSDFKATVLTFMEEKVQQIEFGKI